MIVDLMRNDFFRICGSGNVSVKDPGTVYSFSNVHHLIAALTGRLHKELSLRDCLEKLCPGGSITGAPKKEVMLAISELEKRSRGYFMGNILLFDYKQQKLDSSILIRTVHVKESEDMEFAVGSGIVIASEAESEFSELKAKMRVVSNKS
jgi:para-aminobenzoate synthetase component 1